MARIPLWVKPRSAVDAIGWDPWRKCWVVTCRARPEGGAANRAVAVLVAGWLGLPRSAVRWDRAGTSPAKVLSADGVSDRDVELRLKARTTGRARLER